MSTKDFEEETKLDWLDNLDIGDNEDEKLKFDEKKEK